MTFAQNAAVQETTQLAPYKRVYGRSQATTLGAVIAAVSDGEDLGVASYSERAEEARQLARLRIKN